MYMHDKRLQYTVHVAGPNPQLAVLLLEQFGGPQGELAAAMRYFTQALAEDDPGRKGMLYDISTEELSHLEIIGSIITMLNKGTKGELAEGMTEAAGMRLLTGSSTCQTEAALTGSAKQSISHTLQHSIKWRDCSTCPACVPAFPPEGGRHARGGGVLRAARFRGAR